MDAMLSDLEDFIRSVSDAAGEEAPKFRRSDLAEHLTSFLRQAEDGDAEFTSLGDHAYLAPGGATLFVPGSGTAAFDEVALDSDEALPWLEHYHRQGQHPPEWPAAMPLPEEPIDLEALAQEVRRGQAAERVEQALEAQRAAPEGLASWTQEDLDNARAALQEARWQHASLVSFSQEEADEDEPGLSVEVQAWFEAVEDGRMVLEGEASFAFGLPTPFEEGKHPRGYGGRWANKPGAAEAVKAHGAAEKNLRKHEANLGKLAAKVEKLHQAHAATKAAHAAAKKKAKGKAHSRAALEAHQAELAAIRAKGKLDAAKAAHGQAKKEHAQAKKEHGQTAKALKETTKEQKPAREKKPVREKPVEKKPAATKAAVKKDTLPTAAESLATESLQALGKTLTVRDAEHPVVQSHLADLALVPPAVHTLLVKSGLREVAVGNAAMSDLDSNEDKRGVQPRGWSPGNTWDTVAGAYNPQAHSVAAGVGRSASISLALHEYGHALGDLLGWDYDRELITQHKAIYTRLDKYLQQDGPGGFTGRQELIAEGFATLMKNRSVAQDRYGQPFVDWLERKIAEASHPDAEPLPDVAL